MYIERERRMNFNLYSVSYYHKVKKRDLLLVYMVVELPKKPK